MTDYRMRDYWPHALVVLAAVAMLLVVWRVSPAQLPVIGYKLALVSLGALAGFVINELFLHIEDERAQALIVVGAMVSMAVSL